MLSKMKKALLALHKDEGGADMVEYILIVALVGLPLLALIWLFRDTVVDWLNRAWRSMTENTPFGS